MRLRLRYTAMIVATILATGYAYPTFSQDNSTNPSPNKPAAPAANKAAPAAPSKTGTAAPKHDPTSKDPTSKKDSATAPVTYDHKTAAGFWQQMDDDGFVGGWFYFSEKNGLYEGRLVKMFKKSGSPDFSDKCEKCEGDQKDALMLGLTIVKGMKRDGRNYEEGSILDPRDGTLYHAQMKLSADGKELEVRGYLGIPLLGQTQVWKRLPDDSIAPADIPKDSLGPAAAAQ
jgi:uncharacterized protein (DUF2147 family)